MISIDSTPKPVIASAAKFSLPSLLLSVMTLVGFPAEGRAQYSEIENRNGAITVLPLPLADVSLAIPKDWIDSGFVSVREGSQGFVHFVNLNNRRPPRASHFNMPPLNSFIITIPASGLAASNVAQKKAELKRRWVERQADEHGFWKWKINEYVLTNQAHARPFDQPLIVECFGSARPNRGAERSCDVNLYWTLNTSVRYLFFDTDIPKSRWVELDKTVLKLVRFLERKKNR